MYPWKKWSKALGFGNREDLMLRYLYLEQRKSCSQIAEELKIQDWSTVLKRLNFFGIPRRSRGGPNFKGRKL